jgi:hypothetical protein
LASALHLSHTYFSIHTDPAKSAKGALAGNGPSSLSEAWPGKPAVERRARKFSFWCLCSCEHRPPWIPSRHDTRLHCLSYFFHGCGPVRVKSTLRPLNHLINPSNKATSSSLPSASLWTAAYRPASSTLLASSIARPHHTRSTALAPRQRLLGVSTASLITVPTEHLTVLRTVSLIANTPRTSRVQMQKTPSIITSTAARRLGYLLNLPGAYACALVSCAASASLYKRGKASVTNTTLHSR